MIMALRKFSESWPAKILLGLLAVSMMSVFGLGGVTSLWGKEDVAITVGSNKMRVQDLQKAFHQELKRVSVMMPGHYLSPSKALEIGLLDNVIQQEIDRHLKTAMSLDLETIASDEAVRNYIVNNPNFQTMMGQFDRPLFDAYLRQLGVNEAGFSNQLRQELAQKHVFDSIRSITAVPEVLLEKFYAFENEKRNFSILFIPPEKVPVLGKPSEQDLKDYYDAMQDDLYTPEYRTLSVVEITPKTVADTVVVSDEEIQNIFEETKESLNIPEKRLIHQILITDEASAKKIRSELTLLNFDEKAKVLGLSKDDIDLGWITKDSVLEELSMPAFESQKGAITSPIQTSFGWHILLIKDIKSGKEVQLRDVKQDIIQKAKAEKTYDLMYSKSKEFDNKIGMGNKLEDVAKELGLSVKSKIVTNLEGVNKKGEKASLENGAALQEAFSLPKGEVSALIEDGDGFLAVRVDEIEENALMPFDSVKDTLTIEWKKDKQKQQLNGYAESLFVRSKEGQTLQSIALFAGVELKHVKDMTRKDMKDLQASVVSSLFKIKKGQPTLLETHDGWMIVEMNKVQESKELSDEKEKKLEHQNLAELSANLLIGENQLYYAKIEKVEINQQVIKKVFSMYAKSENNE